MNKTKKLKIADLDPNALNFELTGIVLSKYQSREIENTKNPGETSYVFNFVFRDTSIDFINVACWGSKAYIDDLSEKIDFGSLIRIKNPTVVLKTPHVTKYNAWTTSQYTLTINQSNDPSSNNCPIVVLPSNENYDDLTTTPIREHNDFYTLDDATSIQDNLNIETSVNLLFLVREIGDVEEITAKKDGRKLQKLDLIIFDNTKTSFTLTIWDREVIKFALKWQPIKNVIFATDVKITNDTYKNTLTAVVTSRTIFIVNPNSTEGYALYTFGKTARLTPIITEFDKMKNEAIKCTVQELRQLIAQNMFTSKFVKLNACVTEFNIDLDFAKKFPKRCKNCYSIIDQPSGKCLKRSCDEFRNMASNFTKNFEIKLNIADHSSMLKDIRCSAKPLEKIAGIKIVENLTDEQITTIKWKILLEKFDFLIKVTSKFDENDNVSYTFKLILLEEESDE